MKKNNLTNFSILQRDTILIINGEKYIIINNVSCHYSPEKKQMDMKLELVKEGELSLTPRYSLFYIKDTNKIIEFVEETFSGRKKIPFVSLKKRINSLS